MIYQHKVVMDEKTWDFDISTCNYRDNIQTVLAVLTCPQLPNSSSTVDCLSINAYQNGVLVKPIMIYIIGILSRYKYKKNDSGLWISDILPITNSEIELRSEVYARETWGWRNIKHLWK